MVKSFVWCAPRGKDSSFLIKVLFDIFRKKKEEYDKMGLRALCLANSRSTCLKSRRSTRSDGTAAKKVIIVAVCFVFTLGRTGADFLCKPDQILLNYTVGKAEYLCLDCPACPPGSQPSVPCGDTIQNWTAIHCVPCLLGNEFSDSYDKAQCAACTVCSKGKAVLKNCTRISNSKCSRCRKRYYHEPFSFDCKPCAECCGDRNDEYAEECERYDNKCKVRPTPCSHTQTTLSKTSTPTGTVPTTQETHLTNVYNKTMTGHKEEKGLTFYELKSSLKPTQADDKVPNKKGVSGDAIGSEISFVIVLFAFAGVLCIIVLFLIIFKKSVRLRHTLRCSKEMASGDIDGNSSHGKARTESNRSQSSASESLLFNPVTYPQDVPMGFDVPPPSEPALPTLDRFESPLQNCLEPHHPIQPFQPETTQVSGSPSSPHIFAESSEKTGSTFPQSRRSTSPPQHRSEEASYPNPSDSSQSDQNASSLNCACPLTKPGGPESSHADHGDSPQMNLHTILPLPTSSESTRSSTPVKIQETLKPGVMTLEDLEGKHFEVFLRMCMRLDEKRPGMGEDFERLASCYTDISCEMRDSLKLEFHTRSGSPSRALMSHLKALHPGMPLHQLMNNLARIGRKDIVQELMPCNTQNYDS